MRNPWGQETFKGNYSDKKANSEMTSAVAAELNHTIDENDGTFWMLLEHFKSQVQYIGINYDTSNWHHDYFLALNDTKEESKEGEWNFCGSDCYRYKAYVKNMSDQPNVVHVGAHTWRPRSIPNKAECQEAIGYSANRAHSIYREGDRRVYTFWNDGRWIPGYTLQPEEELEYIVEMDLARDKMSQDWSITAWGEGGEVRVTVPNRESSSFNYISEDNTRLPEDEGREDDGGDSTDTDNGDDNDDVAIGHAEAAEAFALEAETEAARVGEIMNSTRKLHDVLL